jgi:lysine biosynthesis protein LysW
MSNSNIIQCPDCKTEINLEGADISDIIDCDVCGAEMEIIQMGPAKIKLIEEEK